MRELATMGPRSPEQRDESTCVSLEARRNHRYKWIVGGLKIYRQCSTASSNRPTRQQGAKGRQVTSEHERCAIRVAQSNAYVWEPLLGAEVKATRPIDKQCSGLNPLRHLRQRTALPRSASCLQRQGTTCDVAELRALSVSTPQGNVLAKRCTSTLG